MTMTIESFIRAFGVPTAQTPPVSSDASAASGTVTIHLNANAQPQVAATPPSAVSRTPPASSAVPAESNTVTIHLNPNAQPQVAITPPSAVSRTPPASSAVPAASDTVTLDPKRNTNPSVTRTPETASSALAIGKVPDDPAVLKPEAAKTPTPGANQAPADGRTGGNVKPGTTSPTAATLGPFIAGNLLSASTISAAMTPHGNVAATPKVGSSSDAERHVSQGEMLTKRFKALESRRQALGVNQQLKDLSSAARGELGTASLLRALVPDLDRCNAALDLLETQLKAAEAGMNPALAASVSGPPSNATSVGQRQPSSTTPSVLRDLPNATSKTVVIDASNLLPDTPPEKPRNDEHMLVIAPARPREVLPPPLADPNQGVRDKLMTGEELAEALGPVKPDRFGGLWKMSGRRKAMEAAAGNVLRDVEAVGAQPLTSLTQYKGVAAQFSADLGKVVANGTAYLARHPDAPAQKKAAVQKMIDKMGKYKGSLDAVLGDRHAGAFLAVLTVDEAIAVQQCGISSEHCNFDRYNDTRLDANGAQDGVAAGACNTVSKLTYQNGEIGFFKAEQREWPDGQVIPVAEKLGIDMKAPRIGYRNLASRAVSDALGLNVIPTAEFATHNGKVGVIIGEARGKAPREKVWEEVSPEVAEEAQKWLDAGPDDWQYKQLFWRGLQKQDGVWKQAVAKLIPPWQGQPTAPVLASLQEGLNRLEWCDMLTGQGDRHDHNYKVDIRDGRATVMGIDNDLAFGKSQTELVTNRMSPIESVGTPHLIDKTVFDNLMALKFKDLAPRLKGLSEEEISATKQRLALVQAKAADLTKNGLVVENWETWRDPAGRNAQDYLKAKVAEMEAAKNDGRKWSRGFGSLFVRDFAEYC